MKTYRIYTEDLNRNKVVNIVSQHFTDFTIIPASGYWKKSKEQSIIIEIISASYQQSHIQNSITDIGKQIKKLNKQQAILVTVISCDIGTI